jgi:hypothetical protein
MSVNPYRTTDREARDARRDALGALRDADNPAAAAELRRLVTALLEHVTAGVTHALLRRLWADAGLRARFPLVNAETLERLVIPLWEASTWGRPPPLFKWNRGGREGTVFALADPDPVWEPRLGARGEPRVDRVAGRPLGRYRVTSEAAKILRRAEALPGGGRRTTGARDAAACPDPDVSYLTRAGQVVNGLAMHGNALGELGSPLPPQDLGEAMRRLEAELADPASRGVGAEEGERGGTGAKNRLESKPIASVKPGRGGGKGRGGGGRQAGGGLAM